jgi:hypothetical protein
MSSKSTAIPSILLNLRNIFFCVRCLFVTQCDETGRILNVPTPSRPRASSARAAATVRGSRRAACEPRPRGFGATFPPMHTLAPCLHCWHYASMAIQINIRDVPEKVRDELAARAALQGKSMQEFLRAELERLAARPSVDAWLQQVRKRKRATQSRVSSKQILANRNADRR